MTELLSIAMDFDTSFKFYKRRQPPPDLSSVLDLHDPSSWDRHRVMRVPTYPVEPEEVDELGLQRDLTLLSFCDVSGLLYIANPFSVAGQRLWALRAIRDYTRSPPSKTNLEAHPELGVGGEGQPQWWEAWTSPSTTSEMVRKKLRWATLGYHHNWDTKVYSEAERSEFPVELSRLSTVLAHLAGFPHFTAQAAIVNLYHTGSTLAGHTDHSEPHHQAPLLSISFGQSAVFLAGGPSRNSAPVPLLLHSGDVLIMSGASRLSVHGVPRVLAGCSSVPWGGEESSDAKEWTQCHQYLSVSRVNLNIRQVLPPGVDKLLLS